MTLSTEQRRQFEDKGFVVCKGFFDEGMMAKISAWLDDLRDKEDREVHEARFYEKRTITG